MNAVDVGENVGENVGETEEGRLVRHGANRGGFWEVRKYL